MLIYPPRTLCQWINEMSGKWKYPPSYHKISTYQQRNRFEWCNKYLNYNWRDGIWLHDESFFVLDQNVRKQHVFNDQQPLPKEKIFHTSELRSHSYHMMKKLNFIFTKVQEQVSHSARCWTVNIYCRSTREKENNRKIQKL